MAEPDSPEILSSPGSDRLHLFSQIGDLLCAWKAHRRFVFQPMQAEQAPKLCSPRSELRPDKVGARLPELSARFRTEQIQTVVPLQSRRSSHLKCSGWSDDRYVHAAPSALCHSSRFQTRGAIQFKGRER